MRMTIGREIVSVSIKAAGVIITLVVLVVLIGVFYEAEQTISDGDCNIAFMPIEGTILPFHGLMDVPLTITPEEVDVFISAAEREAGIDGLLIEINSPGGTPVASEQIAERIHNSTKPVVVVIGDVAASGGYMVAAAADHVLASNMSTVGSIGVNMSYTEESQKNEEEGITYVQLTSAEFKDAGSPNRPITEAEKKRFAADLELVHQAFIDLVAKYRNMERNVVEELADGASMPGVRAVEVGLIDSIGGIGAARGVLAALTGNAVEDTIVCQYSAPLFSL